MGGLVAAAGTMEGCAAVRPVGTLDPYAIGVISDIHTGLPWAKQQYRTGREYPWQPGMSKSLVQEILSLPNPPATIIGLGDISLAFGEPALLGERAALDRPAVPAACRGGQPEMSLASSGASGLKGGHAPEGGHAESMAHRSALQGRVI